MLALEVGIGAVKPYNRLDSAAAAGAVPNRSPVGWSGCLCRCNGASGGPRGATILPRRPALVLPVAPPKTGADDASIRLVSVVASKFGNDESRVSLEPRTLLAGISRYGEGKPRGEASVVARDERPRKLKGGDWGYMLQPKMGMRPKRGEMGVGERGGGVGAQIPTKMSHRVQLPPSPQPQNIYSHAGKHAANRITRGRKNMCEGECREPGSQVVGMASQDKCAESQSVCVQ
jgi:hypothetical protein